MLHRAGHYNETAGGELTLDSLASKLRILNEQILISKRHIYNMLDTGGV